jgi:hypothetical protein
MKKTLLLFAVLAGGLLPSCTVIHGDETRGTYTLASLGGDVSEMTQTSRGYAVARVDNSTSFRESASTLKNYIWAGALKSVANTAGSALKSVTKTKEATKVTGLQEAGLTDRAGIAAEVQKAEIETLTPTP